MQDVTVAVCTSFTRFHRPASHQSSRTLPALTHHTLYRKTTPTRHSRGTIMVAWRTIKQTLGDAIVALSRVGEYRFQNSSR